MAVSYTHLDVYKRQEKVVEWSKCWKENGDIRACMDSEIMEFLNDGREKYEKSSCYRR